MRKHASVSIYRKSVQDAAEETEWERKDAGSAKCIQGTVCGVLETGNQISGAAKRSVIVGEGFRYACG